MTYPSVPPRPHQLTVDSSNTINTDQEIWLPMTDQNIFGQGMVDITGNGRNATIVDNSVIEQGSFIDTAKGACYYCTANTSAQAGLITGDLGIPLSTSTGFTASIWAQPTVDGQTLFLWASMYTAGGTANQNYQCYRDSVANRFNGYKKTSSKNVDFVTDSASSLKDSWYHVVMRINSSNFSLWIDGTQVVTNGDTTVATLDQAGDTLTIGRAGPSTQSQGGGGVMNGYLQNFRLWSRDLSDTEIGQLFTDPWVGSSYTATSGGGGGGTTSYFKPIRWNKSEDGLNIRRL